MYQARVNTSKTKEYLYVVQKTIMAKSIPEALKKEKNVRPTDIFIDSDWKKNHL